MHIIFYTITSVLTEVLRGMTIQDSAINYVKSYLEYPIKKEVYKSFFCPETRATVFDNGKCIVNGDARGLLKRFDTYSEACVSVSIDSYSCRKLTDFKAKINVESIQVCEISGNKSLNYVEDEITIEFFPGSSIIKEIYHHWNIRDSYF